MSHVEPEHNRAQEPEEWKRYEHGESGEPDQWQGGGVDRRRNPGRVKELEGQLAAEREKYIELCDKANGDMIALNKQLAAERAWAAGLDKGAAILREQLAAEQLNTKVEREKKEGAIEMCETFREQLAAAVEALKEIPEQLLESQKSNPAWSKAELWGIERDILPSIRLLIDAALAKIGGKWDASAALATGAKITMIGQGGGGGKHE